jgi:hypothetical protein
MRERVRSDWVTDLAGRHTLEQTVADALAASSTLRLVHRATSSLTELDFVALGPGRRVVPIELKAKLQPYRGWDRVAPAVAPVDVFILDELALRKLIDAGRYACLIVWDQPVGRWCVWSSLDLVLAPKVRVVRPLAGTTTVKAKVVLDLNDAAHTCTDLTAVIDAITEDVETCDRWWTSIGPWPYGPTVANPIRRTS